MDAAVDDGLIANPEFDKRAVELQFVASTNIHVTACGSSNMFTPKKIKPKSTLFHDHSFIVSSVLHILFPSSTVVAIPTDVWCK